MLVGGGFLPPNPSLPWALCQGTSKTSTRLTRTGQTSTRSTQRGRHTKKRVRLGAFLALGLHFGSLEEVGAVRLKPVRVLLGASGVLLGAPGVFLGVPGDLLGSSWAFMGAPGVLPGALGGAPGKLLGVRGYSWYSMGYSCLDAPGPPGCSWVVLGCCWGCMKACLMMLLGGRVCFPSTPALECSCGFSGSWVLLGRDKLSQGNPDWAVWLEPWV